MTAFATAAALPARRGRPADRCICAAARGDQAEPRPRRDAISDWVANSRSSARASTPTRAGGGAPSAAAGGKRAGGSKDAGVSKSVRADRRGAANALNAVGRLFASEAEEEEQSVDPPEKIDATVTDVDGTDDALAKSSKSARALKQRQRQKERRQRAARAAQTPAAEEHAENDDGFAEAAIDTEPVPDPEPAAAPAPGSPGAATRARSSSSSVRPVTQKSFVRLLDVARRGGSAPRRRKPDLEPLSAVLGVPDDSVDEAGTIPQPRAAAATSAPAPASTSENRQDSGRLFGVGRLLDLARRGPRTAEPDVDEDEVPVREGEQSPRQRFIATRRVGGRMRRVREAPEEWGPMSDRDIGRLRSESHPLDGNRGKVGADAIRECTDCFGTGLEMCSVCVGSGWVEPIKSDGPQPRPLVQQMWARPNLVIDRDGTAQCVYCAGMGKRQCKTCEGSGSALKKGFDPTDKYKVFDMFQGATSRTVAQEGEGFAESVEVEEEFDDFEDVDGEEEESEEFAIYTGDANGLDFGLNLPNLEKSAIERDTEADVIELAKDGQQPSQNGFYDEDDVVDFARPPQRNPILKRIEVRHKSKRKANAIPIKTVLDDADEEEPTEELMQTKSDDLVNTSSVDLQDDDLEVGVNVSDMKDGNEELDDMDALQEESEMDGTGTVLDAVQDLDASAEDGLIVEAKLEEGEDEIMDGVDDELEAAADGVTDEDTLVDNLFEEEEDEDDVVDDDDDQDDEDGTEVDADDLDVINDALY